MKYAFKILLVLTVYIILLFTAFLLLIFFVVFDLRF